MNETNCGELIKHIHCAMQKNANNELRAEDLTFAQVHLLFTLEQQPKQCCLMKKLERKMGVAQSTIAGLVKRCAEKGLVDAVRTQKTVGQNMSTSQKKVFRCALTP